MRYCISDPDEYLAITGMGIRSVRITKAAWVWPLQRCTRFSVKPHDYAMDLQAMTKEKLQFSLPVVFTVGPEVRRGAEQGAVDGGGGAEDRADSLVKYAVLLTSSSSSFAHHHDVDAAGRAAGDEATSSPQATAHVESIVKGIIEGETRVLVSSMTMEEIFAERDVFKRRIFRNIQSELDQFGLKIYNANVKELKDAPGSVYFGSLSRKAHEGATNQARIDVADAQLRGSVGEAQRRGQQEREVAKINAETTVQRTQRNTECAQAEARLDTVKAGLKRDVEIARVSATRALELRDEDLKRDVELKRAAAELERRRACDVVAATVARESSQQDADADAYRARADADAAAYAAERAADADAYRARADADAAAYAADRASDAAAAAKKKDAAALACMADAYAALAGAFGGPQGLLQHLMVENGTLVSLARENASAVRGLEPKISIWNTGAHGDGAGGDGIDALRNVYQMLPPLMTTIHDQTGITLPEWQFGRLNAQIKAVDEARVGAGAGGQAKAVVDGSES